MRFSIWISIALLLVPTAVPTAASDQTQLSGSKHTENIFTSEESAGVEIDNDYLRARVLFEASDNEAIAVSNRLDELVAYATKHAASRGSVVINPGNRELMPSEILANEIGSSRSGKWYGRQAMFVEGNDFLAVASTATSIKGSLQQLSFYVSEQTLKEAKREVTARAGRAFREKSLEIAHALGFHDYEVVDIDTTFVVDVPSIYERGVASSVAEKHATSTQNTGHQSAPILLPEGFHATWDSTRISIRIAGYLRGVKKEGVSTK
jgi:predicted secreted protein